MKDLPSKFYSISEAAHLLGAHPSSLRLWEEQGYLTPSRTPGGDRRYSLEDLEALLRRQNDSRRRTDQSLPAVRQETSLAIASLKDSLAQLEQSLNPTANQLAQGEVRLGRPVRLSRQNAMTRSDLVKHSHPAFSAIIVSLLLLLLLSAGAVSAYFLTPASFKSSVLAPLSSFLLSGGAKVGGTMRFLSTIFFGEGERWYIRPDGVSSLANLTSSQGTFSSITTDYLKVTRSETIAGLNAQFLNSLSSSQFLRSDTATSFTQGALTFAPGTTLSLANGSSLAVAGSLSLPAGSITTADLADLAVTSPKLADLSVIGSKLADSSVTSAKIADGTIVNADVSSSAAIAYSKLNLSGSIVGSDLASNIGITTSGAISASGGVSSSSSISTTAGGTITSSGLLTASNGLTLSSGSLSLPSGSVADSFLTSNVALLNNTQTFTGAKTFSVPLTAGGGITDTGNFSQTGTGTLSTGTGAISLNGNTTLAAGKTFTWTTGAIDPSGNVGIGTTSPGAKLEVDPSSTTQIGQIIKAQASQTADLLQIQNSLSSVIAKVDNLGNLTANSLTSVGNVQGTTLTSTVATGTAPLTVASTTQVANLNANYVGGLTAGQLGATVMPNLVPNSDFGRRNKWMTFMPETFTDTSGLTVVVGSSPSVTSNAMQINSDASSNARVYEGLSTWKDVRMSAQVQINQWSSGFKLAVEKSPSTTGSNEGADAIEARLRNNGGTQVFELVKQVGGVETIIASVGQTVTVGNWYWLELETQGSTAIAKVYSSGASAVAKSSATLLQTLSGTASDSSYASGYLQLYGNYISTNPKWGGLSTGDGGVYVEGWGPEGWIINWVSGGDTMVRGGQAVGFDESADAGPNGYQWAMRTYIPATNRSLSIAYPFGYGGATALLGSGNHIKPSTSYTASVYEKVSAAGDSNFVTAWFGRYAKDGTTANAGIYFLSTAGDTSWTRLTRTVTTESNAEQFNFYLAVNDANLSTGTVWFMLPQLEEGSVATPWRNAPADDGPIVWDLEKGVRLDTTSGTLSEIDSRDAAVDTFLPWNANVQASFTSQMGNNTAGCGAMASIYVDGSSTDGTGSGTGQMIYSGNANTAGLFVEQGFSVISSQSAGKHRFAALGASYGPCGTATIGNAARPSKFILVATRGKFDLAEEYEVSDTSIGAGDVVRLSQNSKLKSQNEIERTNKGYDGAVLGIVSTDPGVTLSSTVELNGYRQKPNLRPLALSGRVPVKVTTENGDIHRGDFLTSSALYPGYAMKATRAGRTIGIALEDFTCAETDKDGPCQGKIMTFVNLSWYDPSAYIADNGQFVITKQVASSDLQAASEGTVQGETKGTGNSREQTANGSEKAQAAQPASSLPQTPVVSQPATANLEPSPASSSAQAPAVSYQLQTVNREVIEKVGGYSTLFVANLTAGKLDASEITLGGKSLSELIERAISQQPAVSSGETVAFKDGQLTLTKVTADTGVFQTIQATVSAAFEKLTAKTAQIAEAAIDKLMIKSLSVGKETTGQATIKAGETKVVIDNPLVTDSSRIFTSPTTPTGGRTLVIGKKVAGESVEVYIETPAQADITFDYWVVN